MSIGSRLESSAVPSVVREGQEVHRYSEITGTDRRREIYEYTVQGLHCYWVPRKWQEPQYLRGTPDDCDYCEGNRI
jgi:hypothetical protein